MEITKVLFSYETWIRLEWLDSNGEFGQLEILGGAGSKLIIDSEYMGKEHFLELMSQLWDESIVK